MFSFASSFSDAPNLTGAREPCVTCGKAVEETCVNLSK
jgi:hypothetical protein